uniref:CSON013640 protein n=1 Tax=Culicoides sonorensis TaxID=179676 RepID=A0A336K0M6_CULSO
MKLSLILLHICIFEFVKSQNGKESRIIGGVGVRLNELPFMISIQAFGVPFCGGSLITNSYILTAATCGNMYPYIPKVAVAGGHSFDIYRPIPIATEQKRTIIAFVNHPAYADDNGFNNIALAKVVFQFMLNRYVMPIPLPVAGMSNGQITTKAFIAGWGSTTKDPGTYSRTLLKGYVPVHSKSTCEVAWPPTLFGVSDICAGVLEGSPAACAGDLGGPLALEYAINTFQLLGVYRYTDFPCGAAGKPSVFTDISNEAVLEWVLSFKKIVTTIKYVPPGAFGRAQGVGPQDTNPTNELPCARGPPESALQVSVDPSRGAAHKLLRSMLAPRHNSKHLS